MTESLLAIFGLYGGALVIGFVAGLFPIVSIELFLVGVGAWAAPRAPALVMIVLLAAVGHQIAKTICYYAGAGALALPKGKLKQRIDRVRARIDRWNRRPKVIMLLAAIVGLPPLYVLAFVAGPLMNMRFASFTAICFGGRLGRYAVLMLVPQLVVA